MDICPHCDGTGERDFLSGARCFECGGSGIIEGLDEDEIYDEYKCYVCMDEGEVPTADYESYFGAMMKPCPACHGKTEGLGHGKLS